LSGISAHLAISRVPGNGFMIAREWYPGGVSESESIPVLTFPVKAVYTESLP